jgi:hypothetical protein
MAGDWLGTHGAGSAFARRNHHRRVAMHILYFTRSGRAIRLSLEQLSAVHTGYLAMDNSDALLATLHPFVRSQKSLPVAMSNASEHQDLSRSCQLGECAPQGADPRSNHSRFEIAVSQRIRGGSALRRSKCGEAHEAQRQASQALLSICSLENQTEMPKIVDICHI